ncbi:MAG TPA: hypothetical protein ENN81_00815 [Phycisphaerales bacterium]|nr:hypothetical protein [Phycisphaerales bacterium]
MNSDDCDSFIIRGNHIHHTGLSTRGATEGTGMYIGCHDGSCRTTNPGRKIQAARKDVLQRPAEDRSRDSRESP